MHPIGESALPVLSIVWHGKNRAGSIEGTLESIRAISGVEIEVIIEDGGSTDGTLDALHRAASGDARIKVRSLPQASSRERLLDGLRRSRGEIVVVCADDGVVLPDTLIAALSQLRQAPDVAALACGVGGETLDIVTLLFSRYRPSLANALVRRRALVQLGLERDGEWRVDCLELEIWQRIAKDYGWLHFAEPIAVSHMALAPGLELADEVRRYLEAGREIIEELFSDAGFFADVIDGHYLKQECLANLHSLSREQCGLADTDLVPLVRPLWSALAQEIGWLPDSPSSFARRSRTRMANFRRPAVSLPAAPTTGLRRFLGSIGIHARSIAPPDATELALIAPLKSAAELPLAVLRPQLADIYAMVADLYEARGMPHASMKMWAFAESLHDIWFDSMALLTLAKMPGVSVADVMRTHGRWVDRHVGERRLVKLALARPYVGGRRIRVGYHCAFMDSETVRHVWRRVIAAHDRNAYEVFGYSPEAQLPEDIASAFDVVRKTRTSTDDPTAIRFYDRWVVSDDRFMQMIRADQIDILVELTGYSPGHRFSAMARRCAPIQVMHMNHVFTSGVPNVDYFVTDNISSPTDDDRDFYTEELVWMPQKLFCFDFRGSDGPPVVDPPCLERGYVTFACFGGGQKYNDPLFELWAEVLRRVPNSRLRLQNGQLRRADVRRLVVERFERLGIAPGRIMAVAGVDRQALLPAYGEVDISLDTLPYGGGLTTAEALWQGVPVVSMYGDSFRSRYSASLLHSAGCWEFVARNAEEYVGIAARLAADPERLRAVRRTLRDRCTEHGLNDSVEMARSLETVYRTMMERQAESDRLGCSSVGRAG